MGNINPERRIAGRKKKKVLIIACCCVWETVDIKRPIPSVERRYSVVQKRRRMRLPLMGISNQNTPTAVMRRTSMKDIMAKGMVFPRISSKGVIGVTISCSIVPISLSLTIAIEVKRRDVNIMMKAITPGTL